MPPVDHPSNRLATRLSFLVSGFGIACWAPLVPFAKQRLHVEDGTLGLLLLCLGTGSIVTMLATGPLSARHGTRKVIIAGGLGLACTLPLLTLASTPLTLALALLLFGGSLGSIDVAMNIHAADVEHASGKTMMSGLHALFSIGGFAGSALMTTLLTLGAPVIASALTCAAVMLLATMIAMPRLARSAGNSQEHGLVLPRGIVLLLAGLAAVTFLAEGAVLDWSALLITGRGLVGPDGGGVGYILFAVAMTVGRLVGDRMTTRLGDGPMLLAGGTLAVVGFFLVLEMQIPFLALMGFLLIGFGSANIVPVLLRQASRQTAMPSALAIGAITTFGYAASWLVQPQSESLLKKSGLPSRSGRSQHCYAWFRSPQPQPQARRRHNELGHEPATDAGAHQ